ncbi:MAG: hypothetical protein WC184_09825 [Acidimicrobiia bacterium]
MNPSWSSPVPGWWSRTWPLVALGLLSVTMWIGRVRNVISTDTLHGPGLVFRLVMSLLFVGLGAVLLVSCWMGRQQRNWREFALRSSDGWRVRAGIPEWGRQLAAVLIVFTTLVWLVQGFGIMLDSNHTTSFKMIHTFLMVGSLIVAGTAGWGLRRSWPVVNSSRSTIPG